eukprot:TRINITY_DN655_c0_g1_i1.p1 TRINITY_DN655_c0_g1~~TRINITY_DN655_c0_g1_i1.p1  ORF type:complete len:181 (+),score=7.63 TRINITY_DN655_c0_g1_i1:31-543(+)
MSISKPLELQNQPAVDLFRDTPIRYFGYTNEVGEAFRPLIPRQLVGLSYLVAVGYVTLDAIDKTNKAYKKFGDRPSSERTRLVLGNCIDCLIWQGLASVAIPGLSIYSIVTTTRKTCKYFRMPKPVIRSLPTAIGLLSVPLIIHPIDKAVHYFMDRTIRPLWKHDKKDQI